MGFTTEVTGGSRDGGVDVIARRMTDVGTDYMIIQCKHYLNGTVGESVVRDILGAWQSYPQATRALIVTSGRFSSLALYLANKRQVQLIDEKDLERMIAHYLR
jgi:HJR/Mrr/RecB family endonuclease